MSFENNNVVSGEFITMLGEHYYAIRNVDKIDPFFISLVSNANHWLFISSNGGLTAGRVSPETALFPYVTVDKIHESTPHTGSKTLISTTIDNHRYEWEPFNKGHDGRYAITRNLYKNTLGNKLCFEEINHDLELAFRYCWVTSGVYGFARQCELENLGKENLSLELVDGIQNILPAGTPRFAQTNVSTLVDAYKWSELDEPTGLALFALYSGITDRAEPCESLKATTVFCLGLEGQKVLLSSKQLGSFRRGMPLTQEVRKRGIRGAYLVNVSLQLAPQTSQRWQLVADVEQSQAQVVSLRHQLSDTAALARAITRSVDNGSDRLARLMARGDAFQSTAEEIVSVHHYANVLFNILRGGTFNNQYQVSSRDFSKTIRIFNDNVFKRHQTLLDELPKQLPYSQLLSIVKDQGDDQLERLTCEYLPITFGRRHGDPSRPWNQFSIKLKDDLGNYLLNYQGNWRDIFQNWEALTFSYPEFIENVIAKFVNASTVDGYNPYRITKEGIDWEIEEPDDPWSYIGYWGDHQVIYLLKLLELSSQFHPQRLGKLLHQPVFSYANVPYRIKPFDALLANAKNTVDYDLELAERIEQRVAYRGADGKLVEDADGEVYQVNLLEKLLVTLLSKLGNLVIDAGIWLNTQRPEWNDANNALVGQGLSMVTLYYMRRYITFLQQLLAQESGSFSLSREVGLWLTETAAALSKVRPQLQSGPVSARLQYQLLVGLGQAASRYRQTVYRQESFSGKALQPLDQVAAMLDDALAVIDHSIQCNVREDGMYQAYNLLHIKSEAVEIDSLYPMLEGQVAALSSGAIEPARVVEVLETLFESDIYRADQQTFMLYPDRRLPDFLEKNRIPAEEVEAIPLLTRLLEQGDHHIVVRDADGCYRFNAEFHSVSDLNAMLDTLVQSYGAELEEARQPLLALYEQVFNHKAFTGRSGGMFGFEGLGCVYWHMVSKLLLAVQENFFAALTQGADKETCHRLGTLYYRIRKGIGFNKTPAEYGAFPTDPYSHTPKHAGAQQPGMTGQVKEEVLTRFGELGVRVSGGAVQFEPGMLRAREFVTSPQAFRFLDIEGQWQELTVPKSGLAFTWCQVPLVYRLDDSVKAALTVHLDDGSQQTLEELVLPAGLSTELFMRSGRILRIELVLGSSQLFSE
ncbi:MAG: hypothetical protein OEU78_05440 [Gammaproteobacteria bacterium]|nr:hypothetical protein [Gammaproteobacteria bacterium]MDH3887927.1 hypothetical protein [Gammaproteobacteria bacterium]